MKVFFVMPCLPITLIKCLKGHKSPGFFSSENGGKNVPVKKKIGGGVLGGLIKD